MSSFDEKVEVLRYITALSSEGLEHRVGHVAFFQDINLFFFLTSGFALTLYWQWPTIHWWKQNREIKTRGTF